MLPRTFTRGLPPCHILVAPKPPPQGPALCSPAPPLILGRPACKAGTVTLRSRLPGAHTFSLPEKTISKAIWGFSSFQEPMVSAHSQENWNDFCAFARLKSSGLAFHVCFGDRPPTAAVDLLSPLLPFALHLWLPPRIGRGGPTGDQRGPAPFPPAHQPRRPQFLSGGHFSHLQLSWVPEASPSVLRPGGKGPRLWTVPRHFTCLVSS